MSDAKRRLLWHGTLLVLLGLATGGVLPWLTSPRLGLAAHVGGVMNGTLVMVAGAVCSELSLSPRLRRLLGWSLVWSAYANWLGLLLAGAFGTARTTPLLGDGIPAAGWQEMTVALLLVPGAVVTLGAVVLLLAGLRRTKA